MTALIVATVLGMWLGYSLGYGQGWYRHRALERQQQREWLAPNLPPPTFQPADEWERWVLDGNTGDDRTSGWTLWEWQDDVAAARARSEAVLEQAMRAAEDPPSEGHPVWVREAW